MKTILYNPIFINPQAYYVFPQLYDIEKGDSFIEPAVYSGYLIIEDLISNTSSQVINTKEVDFTEFAGKRIRISQYTNLGAVVLGEWLLPEGEPSGPSFHQSLVDAWFMSGLSNNDKPSSIRGVKGNEVVLKNFAYSLSSGFGKYNTDFNSWRANNNISYRDSIEFKAEFNIDEIKGRKYFLQHPDTEKIDSFRIKITSNHTIEDAYELEYRYLNSDKQIQYFKINSDGEYILPTSFPTDETEVTYTNRLGFAYSAYSLKDISFTITQLPSAYEGALVFDGVDDYGICTELPILDDYTVICRRNILNELPGYIACKATRFKNSFHFEGRINSSNTIVVYSFGQYNRKKLEENEVSWMTRTSYNGLPINFGEASDTDQLHLCKFYNSYAKAAIYYFALYNKSLTPEEIEIEKERLNDEWLKRKTE